MFIFLTSYIVDYFWIVFLWAIVGWLLVPDIFIHTYYRLTPLIIMVMYLGALDIDYSQLPILSKFWKQIILYYVVMMIGLPIGLYYGLVWWTGEEIAIGVFLLAIAPAGIAAVSFTRLMWGNSLLSLCLAVITTLSFPLLLPSIVSNIIGDSIVIDGLSMMIDLILYCIVPIGAGYLTQKYFPWVPRLISPHIDWISIMLIGCMIAWPVSYNAHVFLSLDLSFLLMTIVGLFILSAVLHIVWWLVFGTSSQEYKIAGALSKWFMNISIVTVIAANYFWPITLIVVMLYEFPRDLMLIPFRWVIKRI